MFERLTGSIWRLRSRYREAAYWRAERRAERAKRQLIAEKQVAALLAPTPWWETNSPRFVREYGDATQLEAELRQASARGWYIESMNTTEGHINVGKTITGTILTGGIYALLGGSRTKGRTVVVWMK